MQLLIKTILRYKLLFLAIVLVCTLFAIILLPQLRLNSEYINLLLRNLNTSKSQRMFFPRRLKTQRMYTACLKETQFFQCRR